MVLSFLNQVIWKPYIRALDRFPLIVKSLTTGTLMGTGDVMAQSIEYYRYGEKTKKKSFEWDIGRTMTMSGVGLCFSGPVLHFWYRKLDRVFKGEGKIVVAKKLACDQLLFAPCVISVFMGIMDTLNHKSPNSILPRIKRDLPPALLVNWSLWPLAQTVTFSVIPPHLRVLFVSIVSVFWNIFLSQLGNKKDDQQ
ncbi:pmp22 family protein [Cavenderia fasciculata]|uniref:Pmp22 family protein n=1 Tax=Cavenderia fasciculata TaxID=261658 RepID=F4PRI7_CACFS|nr:pmp22 family protein [Cavenderia fasciculata]EGG21327.1 pmp22 family protein [Cavenderia fasciculata]|eukprot:XP_004359177.1 pmp22 family protein [Cavenderia fasciculata]